MNDKYASIKVERDKWEEEKEAIKELYRIDSEVVPLNIGGNVHLKTDKDLLTSVEGSKLAALFSDMHDMKKVDDEIFIDRDAKTFESLLNYLRNERRVFPEFSDKNSKDLFISELYFWGIDD